MPFPVAPPEVRAVRSLSRPELCARIFTLRSVLDQLWTLSELQQSAPFESVGRAKVELYDLEAQLRLRDSISEAVQQASA